MRSGRFLRKRFYQFLNNCHIFSKDTTGLVCLGRNLYDGQRRFFTSVFDGLEEDKHNIKW